MLIVKRVNQCSPPFWQVRYSAAAISLPCTERHPKALIRSLIGLSISFHWQHTHPTPPFFTVDWCQVWSSSVGTRVGLDRRGRRVGCEGTRKRESAGKEGVGVVRLPFPYSPSLIFRARPFLNSIYILSSWRTDITLLTFALLTYFHSEFILKETQSRL